MKFLYYFVIIIFLTGCSSQTNKTTDYNDENSQINNKNELNIYTARHYEVDKKLVDIFSKETGITVNVLEGKGEELIERIKNESKATKADIFMTVDAGILDTAKNSDIFEPIQDESILKNVPQQYRDFENYWVGLATRARVIVYSKENVDENMLSTYEDLADPKWKNKILIRSSTSLYNQSLLTSLIELNGEDQTTLWAQNFVKNFARDPQGNDRDQAKAIVAGLGDLAIMNTYYIGLMLNSSDQEEVKVAQSLGIFFPNQETTGTHINISGAGIIKESKNKENALKFIEFLTNIKAQEMISSENYEFPVNSNANLPTLLENFGKFKIQEVDFSSFRTNNKKAVNIMGTVGWK